MKKIITSVFVLIASTIAIPGFTMDDMPMPSEKVSEKVITGKGKVMSINKSTNQIRLKHEPIPALNWPAMNMEFKVKEKALLDKVKIGDNVTFTLAPSGQDYVITSLKQ